MKKTDASPRRLKNGAAAPRVARIKNTRSARNGRARREEAVEDLGYFEFPHTKATLELALLGLIAENPEVSGYDLTKIFDVSMAHYWHVHPSQIYPTLDRMEDFGIIKGRSVAQSGRPNKRVYKIAVGGERLLVEWLESPFEGINLKHPPLLKCRFLGNLGADGAIAALKEERRSWAVYLRSYREIEKTYFADGNAYADVNMMFSMFTLRRGIDWMQENMKWCEWAIGEIERNRGLFPVENMRTNLPPLISFEQFERESRKGRGRAKERAVGNEALD